MRRLAIFMTGQYRHFWMSWNNLVEKIITPLSPHFDISLSIGMDKKWKQRNGSLLWSQEDMGEFEEKMRNEWSVVLNKPAENLIIEWMDTSNPFFQSAVASLRHYVNTKRLSEYWFNYLVHRSGSCVEYAQFARLYEIYEKKFQIADEDLLMRTRCDILLRHPFNINKLPLTENVFQQLVPTSTLFENYVEKEGYENSIHPTAIIPDRWAITFRKNLVYIMPLKSAKIVMDVAIHYGDWDSVGNNTYWFNAESQFRGCLRFLQFRVWEHSQSKDECYEANFDDLEDDFPIYAIKR